MDNSSQTSRKLKFRAWHDEHQRMVYFDNSKAKSDPFMSQHMIALFDGDYGDVMMQFTGLEDKNHKEIYEGDIVRHDVHGEGEKMRAKYHEVGVVKINPSWGMEIGTWGSHHYNYEIIGNIHENKELAERLKGHF